MLTKAQLCGRGRQTHRWDQIPCEWEPVLWYESYIDCINERCERCGRIKATMWNDRGEKLRPRYKHKTGYVYGPEEDRPTADDYRRYQLDRARQLRGGGPAPVHVATKKAAPQKPAATKKPARKVAA
jgi:hypothetical protein